MEGIALPVIFRKEDDDDVRVWIDASAINSCRTMEELKELIWHRLSGHTTGIV
jgi:ribulose kinase